MAAVHKGEATDGQGEDDAAGVGVVVEEPLHALRHRAMPSALPLPPPDLNLTVGSPVRLLFKPVHTGCAARAAAQAR